MIDEWSPDRTGYARFSADRVMRYRLKRSLTHRGGLSLKSDLFDFEDRQSGTPGRVVWPTCVRVVFVMLNPSTADAFKPDRTVSKCCQFAIRWGADVLEVVNLFAFVSPHPSDLHWRSSMAMPTGADPTNTDEILAACSGAARVIAAWGTHGRISGRGAWVREELSHAGVKLEALGLTEDNYPIHPLARGKKFIPIEREPTPWL